jgi:UDP-N-acetyl-D-galactosamine dehydrogenase
VYDPWANPAEEEAEYGIKISTGTNLPMLSEYSAVVLAVAHEQFATLSLRKNPNQVIYDVKGILDRSLVDGRL